MRLNSSGPKPSVPWEPQTSARGYQAGWVDGRIGVEDGPFAGEFGELAEIALFGFADAFDEFEDELSDDEWA